MAKMIWNSGTCLWCGKPLSQCTCREPTTNQQRQPRVDESRFARFDVPHRYLDGDGNLKPQHAAIAPPRGAYDNPEKHFAAFGLPGQGGYLEDV